MLGASTWAHNPGDEVTETELPAGATFSITPMPVRQPSPAPPSPAQEKLRREVAGPDGAEDE